MQETIFVIDDNNMSLMLAKEALKEQYRVITMQSAKIMFDVIEKRTPDLILLDILMPEIDGFEAAQRLRNNSAFANIPIIFLTSTIDDSIKERSSQLGAIDLILKPFSKPDLIEKINKHFNTSV